MMKPTLDEFLRTVMNEDRPRLGTRAWVLEPKFESLYVRYADRYFIIGGVQTSVSRVLTIANVTVEKDHRGKGVFTALLERLNNDYPTISVNVENPVLPRFQNHLINLGFMKVPVDNFLKLSTH